MNRVIVKGNWLQTGLLWARAVKGIKAVQNKGKHETKLLILINRNNGMQRSVS